MLRGLAPPDELRAVAAATRVESLCQPKATETEAGRAACAFSSAQFHRELPGLHAGIMRTVSGWERDGTAARAGLGRNLRIDPDASNLRVARLVQARSNSKDTQDTPGHRSPTDDDDAS